METKMIRTTIAAAAFGRGALAAIMLFAAAVALPTYGVTTHYMPHADLAYSDGFIPTGGVLVFPDVTLADLEGCSYWGRIAGSSIGTVKTALSNAVQAFPAGATGDAIERYDFDLVARENNTVKAVHIQLYNGEGGVYARAVQGWYVDYNANQVASGMSAIHYTVDATTGELTWSGVNLRKPATGPNVADYGIRAFGVARPVTTTATLAYPGLTVAAIAKNASAKLSARMSGTYISAFQGYAAVITPAVVTAGTADAPTAIRCEAQMLDGAMVKSAAFELTDGVGGVHVRLIGGYYKNNSTSIGESLLAADGTQPSGIDSSQSASTLLATGYGLYNLEVNEEARVEADTSYVFDQNTYLTSTAQLVFPGATLMGLEDCAFYGIMDGGYIGHGNQVKEDAYAHVVKRYPEDASQPVQKLFLQMSHWDTTYTKNVIVELTGGTGGVYARAVLASHGGKGNNKVTVQSFGVKDDGSGVTNLVGFTNASVATSDHANGYGIKKLGATRMVSDAARLAFPGLKVSDIFRGEILGRTAGRSINDSDQFTPYSACNRVITSTDAATGAITGFRVEMQTYVGYIKCVELRFTDGDDGVYVEAVRACYADTPYASVGRRMIAQDDSGAADGTTAYTVAEPTFWSSGYGVCNLAVALPDDASTGPATAVWNGGDPMLAASWTCKAGDGTALPGVFPDKHTQVLIASSVTMTADADLTPYASVMTTAANFTINTAGHKLYVKSLEPWHATTITDTAGGGELHLVIPEGYQTYNNSLPLSGQLKLVKDGEGLYLAVRLKQSYSGGTEIKGGIATTYGNAPTSLRNWSMGGNGITNPSGQVITVSEGGTLDINGNTALGYTSIIFNGGTVYGASTQFNGVKRLTADSFLVVTDTFKVQNANYPLELNGHKLSVQITGGKNLHFESCPIKGPGTFEVTSGGWLNLTSSDLACTDADFVIHCALNIGKTIDVHDYRAQYNYNANTWGTTAALNVHGTFTPETDYFTAATLMDGATLDLSAKTGVWSTTSLFTNGNTLSFEEGGTIYVNLGDREMDYGNSYLAKIASWTAKPTNVKFVATDRSRYRLTQRDDGLYCLKKIGTMILVR